MDYKSTLNLPKTDFSMKANLPQREPGFVQMWEKNDIYAKIRKKSSGRQKYVLHDGPPYANGHIHMGHVLNKILKDIIVKYVTLKGYDSPYVPGWDCHGLPVEHQLFKELNLKKGQIDQVSFRNKARDYAMKFVDIQAKEFKRLGIFGRWDKPYLTLNPIYEAQILRSLAKLAKENYIYKDLKPVNWCTTCETALAEAEVEYEDHSSPSVYVKFKVTKAAGDIPQDNTYFIIWTTTPWTLFANVAIAVHPDFNYGVYQVDGEKWVLLEALSEKVFQKAGKEGKLLKKVKGASLEKSVTRHPFIERDSVVVLANYVTLEDGTGCVHTAPGHGQEDYLTGRKYKLPLIMPVDAQGKFDKTCGEFFGMHVAKANPLIIEKMKNEGSLIFSEKIPHSYPHCWRCKNPIIFRATEQWFLKVDHNDLRNRILKAIQDDIKWYPEVGMHRIKAMVENRPDWCLSRQRYWGVPIPAFHCKDCGTKILDHDAIMRIADDVEKEGVDIWFKKEPKDLLPKGFKCPKCNSENMIKENDIVDVWFESGVSHQAVLRTEPSLSYPAELYLEGSDQHRGWFQSSIITAIAIENKSSYYKVLTHGFIVDGEGKKMSKSVGNTVVPEDVMKKYGADIIRLWVSSSNYSDDVRISDEIMARTADAYRKIRNTFRYLLSNLNDFDPKKDSVKDISKLDEVDRWMLSKLGTLIKDVDAAYSEYVFHKVYRDVYQFCESEISAIYLDVLKDRLYTFKKDSHLRRSSQTVLYLVLESLVKIMSPILAFTAEEIWQASTILKDEESVHLSSWPSQKHNIDSWIDKKLDEKYSRLINLRQYVQKALEEKRAANIIGSPLDAKVLIYSPKDDMRKFLKHSILSLPMLFIVSQVELLDKNKDGSIDYPEADISVYVDKADGEKCARCWHYSKTVGENKNHFSICKKCADNI